MVRAATVKSPKLRVDEDGLMVYVVWTSEASSVRRLTAVAGELGRGMYLLASWMVAHDQKRSGLTRTGPWVMSGRSGRSEVRTCAGDWFSQDFSSWTENQVWREIRHLCCWIAELVDW